MHHHTATSYTPSALAGLIRALMSRSWAERRAADDLLFTILSCAKEGRNLALEQLWTAAIAELGEEHEAFISSLCRFWLDAVAVAFSARMQAFDRKAVTGTWEPCASTVDHPDDPVRFGSFDLYGLGISKVLSREATRYASLVPLWIKGLQHPEPVVSDSCWRLLGDCDTEAPPALSAMLDLAFRRGSYFAPESPMKALAQVIKRHSDGWQRLETEVREPINDARIEVLDSVLSHLPTMPESLFNWAVEQATIRPDPMQRYFLFASASRDAALRGSPAVSDLLATAHEWSTSDVREERRAAAWALAYLGTAANDESMMLQLLSDTDWQVRSDAARAVARWTSVSERLVLAVARLLGDIEGHDGYPEANAVHTLVTWERAAAPALPAIANWIRASDESSDAWRIVALINALGEAAHPLHPEVEAFVARIYGETQDPADLATSGARDSETGDSGECNERSDADLDLEANLDVANDSALANFLEEMIEQNQKSIMENSNAAIARASLLSRLGISPDEHIPGTQTDGDMPDEDSETKLRCWISRARCRLVS